MPIPVGSLKKCNCRGMATYKLSGMEWYVYCTECGNKTREYRLKADAQKEWNTEVCYEGYNEEDDMYIYPGFGVDWWKE